MILAYLFGPKRDRVPRLAEVESLRPEEACKVLRMGDLGLIDGSWTILGDSRDWERSRWPMPAFVRCEDLRGRAWRCVYSDSDPNHLLEEEEVPFDHAGLERASVCGAGFVEILMTKLLGKSPDTSSSAEF